MPPTSRDLLTALLHLTDPHCSRYDPARFSATTWAGHFAWDRKRAVKDLKLRERRICDVDDLAEVVAELRRKGLQG